MDPKNPSVPDAREFDAACPGGKAHYIVYHHKGLWMMERTSDGVALESGGLKEMLALVGTEKYPYSRRSTCSSSSERTFRFGSLGGYDPGQEGSSGGGGPRV